IRHRRTGQLVTETIPLSFESSKATASSSAHPPKDPIFHAVEPGADPRPPGKPPATFMPKTR
ncbi:MAG TPA: hypothetical protein VIZ32_10625, partial [Vicinamibacterales bacterium]